MKLWGFTLPDPSAVQGLTGPDSLDTADFAGIPPCFTLFSMKLCANWQESSSVKGLEGNPKTGWYLGKVSDVEAMRCIENLYG